MSHYPYPPDDWTRSTLECLRPHIGARIECHLFKGITYIGTIASVGDYSLALTTDDGVVALTVHEIMWWDFLPQRAEDDEKFLEDFFRTMRQIDMRIGIEGLDLDLLYEVYKKCAEFNSEYRIIVKRLDA